MKNKIVRSICDSLLFKIARVILLCAAGAGMLFSGFAAIEMKESNIDSTPYLESDAFKNNLTGDAHQIVSMYSNGYPEKARAVYSPTASNVQYTLYKQTSSGSLTMIEGNASNQKDTDKYTIEFGVPGEDWNAQGSYWYDGPLSELPEGYTGYRVILHVQKGLPVQDSYRSNWTDYSRMQRLFGNWENAAWIFAACMALFLLVLVMEFIGAGHVRGEEGIRLSRLDRIPFDLVTIAAALLIGGLLPLIYSEVLFHRNGPMTDQIPVMAACLIPPALVFFFWLMSMATRFKSHTLITNNIWYRCWEKLKEILRQYRLPMRIAVVLMLGWIVLAPVVYGTRPTDAAANLLALLIGVFCAVAGVNLLSSHHKLTAAAEAIAAGNTEYRISDDAMKHMYGSFHRQAEALNSISDGLAIAIDKATRSERMKTELITNVSHDIRTPLTSIISYTDLLQKEHTEDQEKEYLDALMRQSKRLKKMTEDIVEASKASSGALKAELTAVNMQELLEQALAEYDGKLNEKNIQPVLQVSEEKLMAVADGKLLWRVLSNLLSNAEKYAMEGTRVFLSADRKDKEVVISVKNVSREPLNISAEELMERFVRGDESRHSEGSGLGLNIAKSLTELMGGTFSLAIDGDLFRADIRLKEAVFTA